MFNGYFHRSLVVCIQILRCMLNFYIERHLLIVLFYKPIYQYTVNICSILVYVLSLSFHQLNLDCTQLIYLLWKKIHLHCKTTVDLFYLIQQYLCYWGDITLRGIVSPQRKVIKFHEHISVSLLNGIFTWRTSIYLVLF